MGSRGRDRFLAALIVMVPCFVLWEETDQGQVYGLYLGAFVYLALGIFLLNRFLGLFMLYIAGWFGFWVSMRFVGRVEDVAILAGVDAILFMICVAIIYEGVVKSELEDSVFINGVCWFALMQATIAIMQYHWFDPAGRILGIFVKISYGSYGEHTAAGLLSNSNYLGAALGICLPLLFTRRKWWLLGIPVVAYALILSACRAAMLGVMAVTVVVSVIIYWKYLYSRVLTRFYGAGLVVAILAIAAHYVMNLNTQSLVERYEEFWKGPVNIWLGSWDTFIFGVGPGITARINNYLHSEPVCWVWNYGALGAGIIAAFIGTTLWKLSKVAGAAMLTCSIVIAVIDMQANHLLHIPVTGLLMVIIMALAQRKINSVLPPKTLMARSI